MKHIKVQLCSTKMYLDISTVVFTNDSYDDGIVMMRAQIFFKDMFVFSGTSVWYVFSTMEPNLLHTRYKQNIMIEKSNYQSTYLMDNSTSSCCFERLLDGGRFLPVGWLKG